MDQANRGTAVAVDDKHKTNSSSTVSVQSSQQHAQTATHEKEEELEQVDEAPREERNGATLEPVKSQPSVNNVASVPNGGLTAWLQVLGAFFLFFNSWGVVNTFGSYQAFYETDLLTSSNPSAISWIGSIQAFLLLFIGTLAGPIYDRGYFRTLLLTGSVLLVLGQMMLSLCTQYYQVLLAQAIAIGLGCGCLFVPSVAILSTYFTTKIATAMGIAASGSSLGGVIYPIVFRQLVPRIGFAWTTRVIGFIILGTLLLPNLCMRVRVLPATRRSLHDLAFFKVPSYALLVAGFFIGFMGLYMPFFYAQVYALTEHITDANLSFYLLAILNSASIFGRILPNFIADHLGPFNVVIPCAALSALLSFCLITAHSAPRIIALLAFYGFVSGSFVSLPPTMIVHLSAKERGKIGTRMGQMFAVVSVGVLVGTPIGGAILDRHGFDSVWIYGGFMLLGGTVFLAASRVCFKGWGLVKA